MNFVALYHGESLLSRAIQIQTRGGYSHAAWVREDGSVIEAWTSGVEHNPCLGKAHKPGTRIDLFEILGATPAQLRAADKFQLAQLGMGYDFFGVLRFISRRKHPTNSRWFCSELVFEALMEAGIDLLLRVEPGEVSPTMLGWSPRLHYVRSVTTPDFMPADQ